MNHYRHFFLATVATFIVVSSISAQVEKNSAKAKIEFYFAEKEPIKGVTGDKKFPKGESESRFVYLHRKPALVLTPDKVEDFELSDSEFSFSSGVRKYYRVHLTLTEKARAELVSKAKKTETNLLMVLVDGRRMNLYRFEIDEKKSGVPKSSMASNFNPSIGYFAKKSAAERIVDALQ